MEKWLGEINEKWGLALLMKPKEILYEGTTKLGNKIVIFKNEMFGKVLLIGEKGEELTLQVCENFDNYDELIAHIAACAHPEPKNILILGGGDGIIARELLKHDVEKITIVEIDEEAMSIYKEFLKLDEGALEDERIKVIFMDCTKFVKSTSNTYDIVIVDTTDMYPGFMAEKVIKKGTIRKIKEILGINGIFITHAGSPIVQKDVFITIYKNIKSTFKIVKPFVEGVPFYIGGLWGFVAASNTIDPSIPKKDFSSKYYNMDVHKRVFRLTPYVKSLLNK